MRYKKRILFVLPSLRAGGAERVISFVSQNLDKEEFEVKLIVIGFEKDSVYSVRDIEIEYLNKGRLIAAITPLFSKLYQESGKPLIVVSSISHVNILMGFFSLFFQKIKFVGREASVVTKMNEFSSTNSKMIILLMKLFYSRLAAIICQSEDMLIDFIEKIGLKSSKLILINNPITSLSDFNKEETNVNCFKFVTVGRLSTEKGYLRILDGLSKITSYKFHYLIIGTGPLKGKIEAKSMELGLDGKISYIPYTSKISEELSKCDYFIQGSFVEGFPNSLLESCVAGTPVIAFNAVGGTKEIIQTGTNGFIVENEEEFVILLNDLEKLKSVNNKIVRQFVVDKFNPEKIIEQYHTFFRSL